MLLNHHTLFISLITDRLVAEGESAGGGPSQARSLRPSDQHNQGSARCAPTGGACSVTRGTFSRPRLDLLNPLVPVVMQSPQGPSAIRHVYNHKL